MGRKCTIISAVLVSEPSLCAYDLASKKNWFGGYVMRYAIQNKIQTLPKSQKFGNELQTFREVATHQMTD
jgi:hypothetical protein